MPNRKDSSAKSFASNWHIPFSQYHIAAEQYIKWLIIMIILLEHVGSCCLHSVVLINWFHNKKITKHFWTWWGFFRTSCVLGFWRRGKQCYMYFFLVLPMFLYSISNQKQTYISYRTSPSFGWFTLNNAQLWICFETQITIINLS